MVKISDLRKPIELLSGRFVDRELPFKISPRMQAKKKKKATTKKRQQHETQMLPSAERSVFGKGMEETFDYLLALGLLAFLWPKASKHNNEKHYKTRGFVVCLLCFLWLVCP